MEIRDRIVGLVRVRASRVRPNPLNWRTHPERQRAALRSVFKQVGIVGAGLARKLKDGTYMLIDGHLRREELEQKGDQKIPLLVLNVTEKEAELILLSLDPLASLADTDLEAVNKLCQRVDTGEQSLTDLFSSLNTGKVFSPEDVELDMEDDGDETVAPPADYFPPTSHVRMVQLFLDTATLPRFEKYLKVLREVHKTNTPTETVLAVLRSAYKNLKRNGERGENDKTPGRRMPVS